MKYIDEKNVIQNLILTANIVLINEPKRQWVRHKQTNRPSWDISQWIFTESIAVAAGTEDQTQNDWKIHKNKK